MNWVRVVVQKKNIKILQKYTQHIKKNTWMESSEIVIIQI